jgi:hypothetical protein
VRATRRTFNLSVVLFLACSGGRKNDLVRDTTVAPATALPAPTSASLSRDTVALPADTGVRVGPDGLPAFPMIFPFSCEGEDCETAFAAFACAPLELRASPTVNAPVVARVARGDTVDVARADLHILRPGMVFVKQSILIDEDPDMETDEMRPRTDTLRFAVGDTVYLLQYLELGWWRFWSHGKTSDAAEFWGGPAGDHALGASSRADTSRAVARSQPLSERWWLLQSGTRPMGWWRVDSTASLRSVYHMRHWEDYCPGALSGEPGGPPARPAP